jgi:PAS domain S-box-containing protein
LRAGGESPPGWTAAVTGVSVWNVNAAAPERTASPAAFSETLFELAPDAIVVVDEKGVLVRINAQAERIFGYARSELEGAPIEVLIPERLRAAHVTHRTSFIGEPRTREMGVGLDLVGRRKDGTEFPVAVALAPIQMGDRRGVIAIARDVTAQRVAERALRESEQRLAAILDNTEALVSLKDRNGRYMFANRHFAQLCGISAERIVGRDDWSVWPAETAAATAQHDRDVLASGRPRQFEERLDREDGTHTFVAVKFPLVDADGSVYAVCTVATDITRRKRAEELLRTAHDELERRVAERTAEVEASNAQLRDEQAKLMRAEKMSSLGVLASGVAHEINNPLAGAMGLVKALRDGTVPDGRREKYLETIADGLDRMRLTLQGMLDYARVRPPSRIVFDLVEMLDSCLRLLVPGLRKKDIDVRQLVAPGSTLRADRPQVMQAVVNVLMNAMYVAPQASIISIELAEATAMIGLRIADQGPGIAPADIAHICDPFYTTKPEGEGTGLGLSIVKNILAAHGGRLAVESELGAGTAVTLWFAR